MLRAVVILGVVIDVLLTLLLILVFGWIIDSWHDPKGAWVGISATSLWLSAFVVTAGGPLLGYVLKRRGSTPGRVALAVWLPAIILTGICAIGFLIFPL
jgi:hypothetical protein